MEAFRYLRIRHWWQITPFAVPTPCLPKTHCFLEKARKAILTSATSMDRWMIYDFMTEYFTPLKSMTFTMQWRLIQTRMVSMMQRKCCSIPTLPHRILMAMDLPISRKLWATILTSRLIVLLHGLPPRQMLKVVVVILPPSPVWKRKIKWIQSGLQIPGWVGVILKLKVLGNGSLGNHGATLSGIPVNQMGEQEKIIF